MICPECGNKLTMIHRGEYCCTNPKCPANEDHYSAPNIQNRVRDYRECTTTVWAEFYGDTQSEINKQCSSFDSCRSGASADVKNKTGRNRDEAKQK